MYKAFAFVFVLFTLITVSITEPRGGRGGGGGRSSSRGLGGRRGSSSSSISSKSFSGIHAGQHPSGGWFHGFFHTPYHYAYIPSRTSRNDISSYRVPTEEESHKNKDTDKYALGYAISRSLSSNFFSIFDMVDDISKIPDKIKNKEFSTTTTTEGPVATYNLNQIINNPPTMPNKIFELDPYNPYKPDGETFPDMTDSSDSAGERKSGENIFKISLDEGRSLFST